MLICKNCGKKYEEKTMRWKCECASPLHLENSFSMARSMLNQNKRGFWRYEKALPLENTDSAVTLGEQTTPLIKRNWNGKDIYFKYDILPTGSYKDRGVAVMLNRLRELGATAVHEDSSGNAGASIAGYCAAADIPCEVMVPESTSSGKCVQIEAYGAKLTRVPGPRDATSRAAESKSEDASIYASHNWSPYFAHGVKTWAFEIWEAFDFELPDAVVVPVGQGSLLLGAWHAFNDLKRGGAINKLPRIYAVQGSSCAPLFEAWQKGLDDVPEIVPPTEKCLAEGIVSTRLIRGRELIEASRGSGGAVIAVENQDIKGALLKLARMGIYVEPTSAVVGAGIDLLTANNSIAPSERVVALLSSSGLKTGGGLIEYLME